MAKSKFTIGCLMAKVSETESGEIISATVGDAKLIFCSTTESKKNTIIITPHMRNLGDAGYLPIAIARIDRRDPTKFFLCALHGLSPDLLFALEHQGCDLVRNALNGTPGDQDEPPLSH